MEEKEGKENQRGKEKEGEGREKGRGGRGRREKTKRGEGRRNRRKERRERPNWAENVAQLIQGSAKLTQSPGFHPRPCIHGAKQHMPTSQHSEAVAGRSQVGGQPELQAKSYLEKINK